MAAKEMYTRENILNTARQEFLTNGYQNAWLRDIAKKAGVTTGALYGYFKNKEELFGALVDECYEGIQAMYTDILIEFSKLPVQMQQTSMEDLSIRGMIRMKDYMYENYDAFKLLLCCSKDTKYADLIEKMAALDHKATDDFAQVSMESGMQMTRMLPSLEHILNTGLFTMFFELIVQDVPKEETNEYITSLMRFYQGGYSKIMGF